MSISAYSREELEELSMVEVAYHVLKENKQQTFNYFDLLNRVVELKGMSEEEKKKRISYLYTDLNVDGRFMCIGNNEWGLKAWYPIEKIEEDIITAKPRKKAKATEEDDFEVDEEFEDFEDEFEEIEDELDELADNEDSEDFEEEDLDGFSDDEEEEFEEEDEDAAEEDDELS
ncbi:DNA-directed RNA polymerase subunit delta [Alkalihalobacterium chitinilyticum]|uniref:Probable DNA-directed RNA polymerase subunit delta n=1 Tax=Alkalihalobacterium chitinilyticum TaxID=2980103 RepID=A0ABT5VGT1_9BACI|nr:DNA-directed RNA polymerase subunit delta [Alkalihalobacterium chitinilyticum]MDE5414668.1 DNA-directed RNA polymerase subunit delta [Alkalihalobacterium chitinilyticum]